MKELIVPRRLKRGDTVAFISISGGRAGDPDMIGRYRLAKSRFEEAYGVSVVKTPHALSGSAFLYSHPELRAEDLHWALNSPEISGIVCNMGGDDSYRVLPHIDPGLIREHPKVFMGYSDIATWMTVFAYAGVRAYYGPNVLTPFGQPGKMDEEARAALLKVINEEVHRNDLAIIENVDFIHRTPMTVLPTGAVCKIDCERKTMSVTEPGAI